jgi:hypothetical protein
MIRFLKVMADNHLDAIMYMEHQPTLLKDGASPPWVNTKAPHLNTFEVFVPVIGVPPGFTVDRLSAGITFGAGAVSRRRE